MTAIESKPRPILYARREIWAFRGVERFSDYKKIKAHMRLTADDAARKRSLHGKRGWRSPLSDRGIAAIIAAGTVALVLIAVATLIVMLR